MTGRFNKIYEDLSNAAREPIVNKRQQSPRMGAGWRQKHQKLLPAMHRIDPTVNAKIETMRKSNSSVSGIQVNDPDLEYIKSKYNIRNLDVNTPKELGTTGIKIQYNPSIKKYFLYKT